MTLLRVRHGVEVRTADTSDLPWLVEELRNFAMFYGTSKSLMPTEDYAREFLAARIDAGPFFVAHRDYTPVGFIAGILHPHLYNPAVTVLTELFWWVSESERGGRAGAYLLYEFERYGREHADMIAMSMLAVSPLNPKVFTRRGYHLHESTYLLEV